ncbi:4,5-DOPA dioxygenase extradiol [Arcicella rigui]|uniref:4,5-DOPA dioxygenase extradiol n=1 Tax=Arcicella rigui TaxID=797020 RepID=A0ABU5Q9H7_9BACT|nr:4,5-DOPA dioxygenase extradiol [Arcicella rigui]MEA5139474.1 4,5-DOPA dioxygenase extradiol [Arcicella rigui]
MKRKDFIKASAGVLAMTTLGTLKALSDQLSEQGQKTPLLFIGHGSPMNGIENNQFSQQWEAIGREVPNPTAVICISAHWLTRGTFVTAMEKPKTIHDFGGFPKALFDVQYPALGSPAIAEETKKLITKAEVHLDHDWGLDHGTWTIIRHIYPKANIPVLQLSIDYYQSPQYHYELAQELAVLRRKGVLIIGSGNMVHNLRMVDFQRINGSYGYDWAIEINHIFKKHIAEGNHKPLINYESLGQAAKLAIPTPDHYYPLLYILGMQEKNEEATFFNDVAVGGSLTMTSVKIA